MTKQERCPIHKPGWYSECSTCNPDTQGQPEQTTSEREREIAEFRKALSCLYIAVDKSVADDVNAKANAVLAQIATLERKTVFCGGCGKTYQSPQDEDKHGFGKCVLKEGK